MFMKYIAMYRKYILPFIILSSVALPSGAQSIDPTVEVSRTYRGKMIEVHKPMFEMQVPDSVSQFDLDFDYSVFESPYKGSYEFIPYLQNMKPQPDAWSGRRFFLRAGAGYPLHPVFDLVWSPDLKGKFRMSVYATHRSYVGRYRGIVPVLDDASGSMVLDSPSSGAPASSWSGYDMLTRAGVEGAVNWDKGVFSFDVGYRGLATKDTLTTRGYNALEASLRVSSKDASDRHFLYDVSLSYRYGADNLDYGGLLSGSRSLDGHELVLGASVGQAFSSAHRFVVDVDADFASYSSAFGTYAGRLALTPRYVIDKGRWNVDLGVMLSVLYGGGENGLLPVAQDTRKGQYVYPDISIGYEIIRSYLEVYADIGGGDRTGMYSDLIGRSHFVHPLYTLGSGTPLLDNTVERVSGAVGFRGNISSRFSYDLKAGYRNFANAPLFSVVSSPSGLAGGFFTALGYAGYQMFYASLDYGWDSADFSIDGNFTYRSTDIPDMGVIQSVSSISANSSMAFFAPAAFSGDVRAVYNWRRRIYIGADCDFSLARESSLCRIGGYADLGLYLEFRAARLFSFWLRGGNLLNMTVQHTPMYAESGINFTAGICLNL